MKQEIANLRVRLQASEAAVAHLEWQQGCKGKKKLKTGARKLNETLKQGLKGKGFCHA